VASRIGDRYEQARAHEGVGDAFCAAGNLRRACLHWGVALKLYSAIGSPESSRVRARLSRDARTSAQDCLVSCA
jgi:hypothetical protein